MAKYQAADPITWLQVHNLLPILGGIVATISVFNVLSNRVNLAEQRIEFIESKTNSCLQRQDALEEKVNSQAVQFSTPKVKGVSTSSGEPKQPAQEILEGGPGQP